MRKIFRQIIKSPHQNSLNSYGYWYDTRGHTIMSQKSFDWKRYVFIDWDSLIYLGDLQSHQSPFRVDSKGVYRVLYKKKKYYFEFLEGPSI